MNPKDLRYLVAVAETGTLRRAADACGVSQPTISAQLAKLEDELDQLLLERRGRGVALTPAGEQAVQHARRVLEAIEQMKQACRPKGAPLAGPFRLGVIPTAGPYLIPEMLPAVKRAFPETSVYLREEVTEELLGRLRDGELEAAVLSLPFETSGLATHELMREPFYAVVPADHPLAGRKSLGADDLMGTDLLLLEKGHCLREQTLQFCQASAGRDQLYQSTSVESLRQMVSIGIGCSVLPAMAVRGRHARTAGVRIIPIKRPRPERTMVLAWRKSFPAYGSVLRLAKVAAQALDGTAA